MMKKKYPFCWLKLAAKRSQVNKSINQNTLKSSIKEKGKHYYKTLGTSVINSLLSPLSLFHTSLLFLGGFLCHSQYKELKAIC